MQVPPWPDADWPDAQAVCSNAPDEATRAALEAKGVQFFGETLDTGVCHMAFFADPEGNELMLHRRYAPYAS